MVGHGGAGVGREFLGTVLWTKSRQSLEKQEVDDDYDDDDPSSMITMVGAEPGEGPHPRKGTHYGRNRGRGRVAARPPLMLLLVAVG